VQSEHADPVWRYYDAPKNARRWQPVTVAPSVAQAAMIGNPVSFPRVRRLAERFVEQGGERAFQVVRVTEQQIMDAMITANRHGHIACTQGGESFADFSLRWYGEAERSVMELTLDTARSYAVHFARGSGSMLFQGGTGLGKTFLSGCIAKTVSGRGYGVVYEGVQNAFAAFEEQKFSRDAETYTAASEKVRRILECDLLILDDLGTELTTSFTQSALYTIVNTRLCEGRSTIISTNLSDAELEKRYLPQTVSRILGEYDVLPFVGADIRAQKKERRYRD